GRGRLRPVACLAIAALVAFAIDLAPGIVPSGRVRGLTPDMAGMGALVAAVAVVAVGADLHFNALRATVADAGNTAYKALAHTPRDAHLLEVPVFLPDVHYGSV